MSDNLCLNCESELFSDTFVYCIACRTCAYCSLMVTNVELELCLKQKWPTAHARCHMVSGDPAKAHHYDLLNLCRLIVVPDVELSEETNCIRALNAETTLFETYTSEQKYLHLKMLETVYSATFALMRKDSKIIKAELLERDSKRMAEGIEKHKLQKRKELPTERKRFTAMEKLLESLLTIGLPRELALKQAKDIWESKRGAGSWEIKE